MAPVVAGGSWTAAMMSATTTYTMMRYFIRLINSLLTLFESLDSCLMKKRYKIWTNSYRTGNTETQPKMHINMIDPMNSQNMHTTFNQTLLINRVKGINAINPPIHPGIHIRNNNINIVINENFVNIPKIRHRIKGRKPVCGISLDDPLPMPMTILETFKNLFNIRPPSW